MTARSRLRQPVRRVALIASVLLILGGSAGAQTPPAHLQLSNAPITVEYPGAWKEWAISLASYADVAARDISEIIGAPIPAGTIRWEPAASGPGAGADGVVAVHGNAGQAVVVLRTNVPLMLQDFGAAYALGFARWMGAYAVGRVAMGAPGGNAPWWTEGAALYLTARLFRDSSTTTPVLYGIQGNFTRAAQTRRPVDLAAPVLSDAARGKALATFNLLEAIYGPQVVGQAIGRLVTHPSSDLAAIVDAIGRDRDPDADALLRDWLEPSVSIDVRLDKVDVHDDGSVSLRLRRNSPFAIPVALEVQRADGGVSQTRVPPGVDDTTVQIEAGARPTSVTADPQGLIPDVNRSNNRQGFGNAENIRRFFTFDDKFSVGEIQFGGEITLDATQQRQEPFQLSITNRSDRAAGLGLLVSAEWLDRPERVQRAYFVNLGPKQSKLLDEHLGYPGRGSGRARVEARFWAAASVEDLTKKLIAEPPGTLNSYVILRDAPAAPRRAQRGIYRHPPTITETTGIDQPGSASEPPSTSLASDPVGSPSDGGGTEATAAAAESFGIHIASPTRGTVPIGAVVLEAQIRGNDGNPERVDFFVNDRRVGTVSDYPYRMRWEFPDQEQVFVIRAVAIAGDRLASDDLILDKGAIAFGATVNLVTIHATVRDGQNRLVRDLSADDFRVVEDGAEQKVVQFDYGEVPVSAALLLDQSSSMIGSGIRAERAGGRRLIDSLVNDVNRAMVMAFNDRVYLYSDLTTDVDRLHQALDAVDPDGSTALFDTLAEAVRKVNRRRGKRALIVLTDGLDTHSRFKYEDVVEYLRQTDVLVYTIGMQLMQEGTEYGDASKEVKRGVERLRALAESTGGSAYFPLGLDELEGIYGQIADELNSQYALSYYPANQRFDGVWRALKVSIPGHPEYWIQVRPGYYGIGPDVR